MPIPRPKQEQPERVVVNGRPAKRLVTVAKASTSKASEILVRKPR